MIKFDELTLDEIEEMEQLLGKSIEDAFSDGNPKGRALKVLIYVSSKRENPKFTMEDAGKFTQAQAAKFFAADSDPKE